MNYFLLSTLALSSVASASKHQQKVLAGDNEAPSFIETSIFARRIDIISLLPDPVTLPPTYTYQELEDWQYATIGTFAHLDFTDCMKKESNGTFDIGIVGHPFDLGVSFRPGARFGPNGARQGARRISPGAGWE